MNREVTLAKCPVCEQLHPADEKCECQKRRCVNCGNNKRTPKVDYVECRCEHDGHEIGYVECFEGWCKHWRKDRQKKKKRKHPELNKNCYNCNHCQYIGEGDYICDMNNDVVIEEWQPSENFNVCKGKDFENI